MNYMSKIAEMLGVEMGEKFKIASDNPLPGQFFRLTKQGLIDNDTWMRSDMLSDLLKGTAAIERLPWKPKDGDHYWYAEYDEGCALCRTTWSDSSYDLALYKLGKLYRTKAEAEKHADEDAAYWESIREEIDG